MKMWRAWCDGLGGIAPVEVDSLGGGNRMVVIRRAWHGGMELVPTTRAGDTYMHSTTFDGAKSWLIGKLRERIRAERMEAERATSAADEVEKMVANFKAMEEPKEES